MRPRRLLILSYFFPPLAGGGVHRVLGFTRYLPSAGWACTVICARGEDYWVRDPSLLDRVAIETEVLRVPGGAGHAGWPARARAGGGAPGRRRGALFARLRTLSDWLLLPDAYRGWSRRAAAVARTRIALGGIDAVLTTSPPDSVHLAGLEIARATGLPWVVDFRDPWIGLHFRTPPTPWHRRRHQAMERSVIDRADRVLAASRTHAEHLRAAFAGDHANSPRAVEHLPNGFEPEIATEPPPVDPARPFTLVFTGTLSLMEDARTFLDALHEVLARHPQWRGRVRAVLAGPYDLGYEAHARALGLHDVVSFPGPMPHAATRALQRDADLLLLWKPHGEGYRAMVPGKLYEYLDSGRPLLALLDPTEEAGRMALEAGATLVPPRDRAALAEALERLIDAHGTHGRREGVRPAWLAGHTREALSRRLAALLDGLVGVRA